MAELAAVESGQSDFSKSTLWLKIRKTSRFYLFVMHSKPKKRCFDNRVSSRVHQLRIGGDRATCILGDPGAVSRDDTMFVVKVYCKIETSYIVSSRLTAPGSPRMGYVQNLAVLNSAAREGISAISAFWVANSAPLKLYDKIHTQKS